MKAQTFAVAAFVTGVVALNNGIGRLPALGYDTYNAFAADYDQEKVLAQAHAMKRHGLLDLGYKYFILDDFYSKKKRDAHGRMVADPKKFPHGMKNLTASMKKVGVEPAIYSSSGWKTCGGYPASWGREKLDVETWMDWGFSYLKYDNCYIPPDHETMENEFGRFKRMADAIAQVASEKDTAPMFFSLCQWGWQQPWVWAHRLGHSWRTDDDIKPYWSSLAAIINEASFNFYGSNFYGHNDMDMLEVGNTGQGNPPGNLTYEESKSHFTAWALLKSPLIIGTDLTNATKQTLEILGNKDLIKIHQDPYIGESISPFRWGIKPDYVWDSYYPAQYWSGNSSYGVVFMVLNTEDHSAKMSFNLTESWAIRAGRKYAVYDMWSHTHNGTVIRNMEFELPPHGVAALLLNDAGPEPAGTMPLCAPDLLLSQCSFRNGTHVEL